MWDSEFPLTHEHMMGWRIMTLRANPHIVAHANLCFVASVIGTRSMTALASDRSKLCKLWIGDNKAIVELIGIRDNGWELPSYLSRNVVKSTIVGSWTRIISRGMTFHT
jgi:hypothetical protein